MKQCSKCGHENRVSARFCESCGEPVAHACESCGTELRASALFCDQCGAPQQAKGEPRGAETFTPLPRHLEAAARRDHPAMLGERRIVTVLFADAVGSTPIAEMLDEEEVYSLMQGCFERMQTAVHEYEGTVNQFTGDGILALFGAPIAHEDSARHAVAAGLRMQGMLADYAEEVKRVHPIQCSYRVGINTGPVVVGRISENLSLDFAAVGDTVNLAQRMESMADSGAVNLSENTYRVVRDYFECEDLGAVDIKGKARPVSMYRAVREKRVTGRIEAAAGRGFTPYVGRARELEDLRGHLERARQGEGQVVLIHGEPGIGKSRLLLEFRQNLSDVPLLWINGQCISYGKRIPYHPIVDLIKDAFAVKEGDSEAEIIQKVNEATRSWDTASRRTVPYLRYLLNVDTGDHEVTEMDPMSRRAGFLDAMRALVSQLAAERTLVISVEDLHWIDSESQALLEVLVDACARQPVLMLLSSRPLPESPIRERTYTSRMVLAPLTTAESAACAAKALGEFDLPASARDLIWSKAEGNPFFIEEVVRSLMETGQLREESGQYRLAASPKSLEIPDTIQDVILARIDRLEAPAREALQLASVIGREFTVRLLERISEIERRVNDSLDMLKSLELIYEKAYFPELSFMFKHALTHDVAYSTLLHERRRELHRGVAGAIETLFADRLAEHYEALAHHYRLAEDWERTAHYAAKSAEKSASAYANRDAVDYWQQAMDACDRLGPDWMPQAQELSEHCAATQALIGDPAGAIATSNRGIAYAHKLSDRLREGRFMVRRSYYEWINHQFSVSLETAQKCIRFAPDDAPDIQFGGQLMEWWTLITTGRHAETHIGLANFDALERARPEALDSTVEELWGLTSVLARYWTGAFDRVLVPTAQLRLDELKPDHALTTAWSRALCLGGRGLIGDAFHTLEFLMTQCERFGEVFYRIRGMNTIGWLHNLAQDFDNGMAAHERSIQVALDTPSLDPEVENNSRLNYADCLMGLGRLDEAKRELDHVAATLTNPPESFLMSMWTYSQHFHHSLGELLLMQGDFDGAAREAMACLKLARETHRPKNEAKGLRLLGEAARAMGDIEGAIKSLEDASRVAQTIGDRTQFWLTGYALCEALRDAKRKDEAAQAYAAAWNAVESVARDLESGMRETFMESSRIQTLQVLLR